MARKNRRLSNYEISKLQKIEHLLDNDKKKAKKETKKEELVQKVKEAQQTVKVAKQEPMLKAGKVEIAIKDISLSSHAYDMSRDRFNFDNNQAKGYFLSQLKSATYIGIVEDEESSRPSHLFAVGRIAIHLTLDLKKIITVYKNDKLTYDPLKEKVLDMHRKRFNRFAAREKSLQRKLEQLKLEGAIEIAECRLRMHKSKSEVIKNVCKARISAIEQSLQEYQNEIIFTKQEKKRVARSMISCL